VDTPNPHHPTTETLRAYSLGKLDDASAEAVLKHIEDCEKCRRQLAEMSLDSFLGRLRYAQEGPQTSIAGSAVPVVPSAGPTVDDDAIVDSSASPCMSSTGQVDETSDALNCPADTSLPSGTRIGYFGDYELLKARG
jgi:Putative zinc-finger